MAARHFGLIEIDRIFLYEENPRHEPIDSQQEIIECLCRDEQVFNLARSIADAGTNPLDLLGLVQPERAKKSYDVWEGNRRVCAIKLLNDPELAPAHLRKDFRTLAKESAHVPITKINSVVFDDHDDLKYWMGVIHNGLQGGVGRKDWDPQQRERHFGSGRNRVALAILDVSEQLGLITKEERVGKITTAQRFLNRQLVKEALGIDATNPDDITFNRPTGDFQRQLSRFITDLKDGTKVTSRHNQTQIDEYGRKLAASSNISGERVAPQSLKAATATAGGKKSARKTSPKKARKVRRIEYDKVLAKALEDLGNSKLESLYSSICTVYLEEHSPLLTIGAWAFVESLAALAAKLPDADFLAFYSNERIRACGLGTSNKQFTPIRDALGRIQRNGNTTKHHAVSALFDGRQLANDVATITPLLIKTAQAVKP